MAKNKVWPGMLLVLLIMAAGCDNSTGGDIKKGILSKIDITGAVDLFIAQTSPMEKEMFKTTEDGDIHAVEYLDEKGNKLTDLDAPSAVYNVNDDYVMIFLGWYDGYLTRKSDGAVFSLNNAGTVNEYGQDWGYKNSQFVQTDTAGNIYYCKNGSGFNDRSILKIDVSNPNSLTVIEFVKLVETNDQIVAFDISPSGHVIYMDNNSNKRIKKANGGLDNLPMMIYWWIGYDGKIKYIGSGKVTTVTIDNEYNVTQTDVAWEEGIASSSSMSSFFRVYISDRIMLIGTGQGSLGTIFEVENPAKNPRVITIPDITIKNVAYSGNYYYLSGNNSNSTPKPVLLKVNPTTDAVTELLAPGLYDIYKMTVSDTNIVTFNAERMSDGKIVIGRISATGTVSIINETLNVKVSVLERIK